MKRVILGIVLLFTGPIVFGNTSEVSLLVLKTETKDTLINPSLLALRRGNTIYLPFEYLTEDLHLSFSYRPQTNQIKGWLGNEKNEVWVNLAKQYAVVGKRKIPFSAQDVLKYEGELFLSTNLIDQLVGTSSELHEYSQRLLVQTPGNLPFEEEKQREKLHRNFTNRQQQKDKGSLIPSARTPWISAPFLDLSARYNLSKNEDDTTSRSWGYSANAAFMTWDFDSQVNVYTPSDKEKPIISLSTQKIDEEGEIFGMFKQLTLGDTYAFSNAASGSSPNGWGVKISTDSALQAEGRTYTLRDVLPLGWEVELYRNNELLGYQNESVDGYFEFQEIPLLLGKNIFKLVFYGPQGQHKEREVVVFFNGNILGKGKTRVLFNALDKNRYLVELRDKPRESALGHSVMAQVGYGLSNRLTLNVSGIADSMELYEKGSSAKLVRKDKNFVAADLSLLAGGVLTSLGTVVDFEEQAATVDYYTQTSLLDWDLTFENIYYGNTVMQRNQVNTTYIKNDTTLRLNHTFSLGNWGGNFPFSYSLRYFSVLDHHTQTEQNFSLSKNLPGNVYMNVAYQDTRWLMGSKTRRLTTTANHVYGKWNLRASASYDFVYNRLYDTNVSLYRTLTQRLKVGAKYLYVSRDLSRHSYENRYAGSINYQTKLGFISLEAGNSNRHNSYAFIGYNLSLVPDWENRAIYPNASKVGRTGAFSALTFVDLNNNGVREQEEPVLEEVKVKTNPRSSTLDSTHSVKQGATVLTHLPIYQPIAVSVDTSHVTQTLSLINPTQGQTVMLRPAQLMRVEIPVIGTGDIEGTVYQVEKGKKIPARGMLIRLLDENGHEVASKVSEYDGFYAFSRVPLGQYYVLFDKDQGRDLSLWQKKSIRVHLNKFEQLEVKDVMLEPISSQNRKR